ncbi:MAG: hypothetical protein ACAI35_22310, partial [Candidatus Methylacidiphilales bacterium]
MSLQLFSCFRRCRPPVSASSTALLWPVLLMVALFGFGSGGGPVSLGARQPSSYIPANFNTQTDALGFSWDLNNDGRINQGSNGCFTQAMSLMINTANFQPTSAGLMSPDGTEYILTGNAGGQVEVTRRIKFDLKGSCLRYVDTITNSSSTPVPVQITLMSAFTNRFQSLYTDRGTPGISSLTARDTGVLALHNPNSNRPSALFVLSAPNARLRPTIVSNQNYQLQINYSATIEPGKRISIATIVAQRNLNSSAPTPQILAPLFKPLTLARVNRDLPSDLRGTVLNAGAAPSDNGRLGAGQLESLNIPPAPTDTLALGEDTRLTGTLTWQTLAITTAHGKRTLQPEEVAALTGPQSAGHLTQAFLRDGQILTGTIEATGVRFTLSSGSVVDLSINSLDRIVMRQKKGAEAQMPVTLLDTTTGDRLSIVNGGVTTWLKLLLRTPWGERTASLEEIISLRPMEDGNVGYRVALSDGSVFTAFLDGDSMTLQTALFGERKIPVVHVRGIYNP